MCGIAGLCGWRGDWKSNLIRMCERMQHRGPDGSGLWAEEDGSVALGHRRLAIVDLSETGAQPMQSHSGRLVVSFNGEIYNYREIAERLIKEGRVQAFREPRIRRCCWKRRSITGSDRPSPCARECLPRRSGTKRSAP